MIDKLDQYDIEKRLVDVNPQLSIAFASRCCLRILPLLASDENDLFFWNGDDLQKHLLAIMTTLHVSINYSVFGRRINITDDTTKAATYAASIATSTAVVNIVNAVVYSVNAAIYALDSATYAAEACSMAFTVAE